jgi:hypothetical protein
MKPFAALLFASLLAGPALADPPAKPKFTVGKETTYVTGPLDKDGFVDYVAAFNDYLAEGVTAKTNAAVVIWQALGPRPDGKAPPAGFFKRMGMDEPADTGDYFVTLPGFLRDRLGIRDPQLAQEIDGHTRIALTRPWTAKEFPQLADWLSANEKPLGLVVEGSKRPHYFCPRLPGPDEKFPGMSGVLFAGTPASVQRSLATALGVRATFRLEAGKPDEATRDILAARRLARHFGRGGNMIDGLVGNACEAIAIRAATALLDRPEVTAKQLTGHLADLRSLPPMPGVADSLQGGERLFFLDNFLTAARSGPAGLAKDANLPAETIEQMDFDAGLRRSNLILDRVVEALRKPDRANRGAALDRLEAELKESQKQREAGPKPGETPAEATGRGVADVILTLAIPAMRQVQSSSDRVEQGNRNLQVAFALAIHQRDTGHYPKALADLSPKYLDQVPGDLFSGKPLIYKPEETGFLLYSVGPNGKDDGGQGPGEDPKGDDIAVRIPIPAK